MSCNAKNPLLSEGRRFANGAKSADGQLDGFPDQWGTCPMFLGRDVCGGSFPAGRVSRPSHKARLFPQVKNLFKRGVPVGQRIYSAGGYISAAPYELSGAASAISQNHISRQSLIQQCPRPNCRRKTWIARRSITEIKLV
jgi:hypothetical protein